MPKEKLLIHKEKIADTKRKNCWYIKETLYNTGSPFYLKKIYNATNYFINGNFILNGLYNWSVKTAMFLRSTITIKTLYS